MPCSVLGKDSKNFDKINERIEKIEGIEGIEQIEDASRDVGAGWV